MLNQNAYTTVSHTEAEGAHGMMETRTSPLANCVLFCMTVSCTLFKTAGPKETPNRSTRQQSDWTTKHAQRLVAWLRFHFRLSGSTFSPTIMCKGYRVYDNAPTCSGYISVAYYHRLTVADIQILTSDARRQFRQR